METPILCKRRWLLKVAEPANRKLITALIVDNFLYLRYFGNRQVSDEDVS